MTRRSAAVERGMDVFSSYANSSATTAAFHGDKILELLFFTHV